MRVLLVSQYFPPEPGATQNRMASFAEGLLARGHDVSVVCEQPNHPTGRYAPGFGRRPWQRERGPHGDVHRLWVATSPRKTTARRAFFYGSFAAGAALLTALLPRHDVVLATSPPLPGALAACRVAALRRIPFVLDVRDLWPAAAEALGELSRGHLVTAAERAERWLYREAAAVIATTRPFCSYIAEAAPKTEVAHIPNGALDSLVAVEPGPPPPPDPFVVGYVGNLGIAQGLRIITEAAKALREDDVRFRVVGDGPLGGWLRAEIARRGLGGIVEIRSPVPTGEVGAVLAGCHSLLVPLGAHPALADFVPSKLFDAMAAGRPVLLAATGESRAILEEHGAGIAVDPEDASGLVAAIRRLHDDVSLQVRLGAAGRAAAENMSRSAQIGRLDAVLCAAVSRAGLRETASGESNGHADDIAARLEHEM